MRFRRIRKLVLAGLALIIPATGFALLQKPRANAPAEPVAALQRKLDRGEVKLEFEENRGYLSSLLKTLHIPVSSQVLVFSKSSFDLHLISPERPRALYFNDDVYVGYVRGGRAIEIASVDPRSGPVFYILNQENKNARLKLETDKEQCLLCHDSSQSANPVPRLLMLSVLPDPNGAAIGTASLLTTDRSPLRERWGGWYVTGTHGAQRHLGNTIVTASANSIGKMTDYIAKMNLDSGANVSDLRSRVDTKPYLTRHSDIVALMVLAHQTHLHNLITLAGYKTLYSDSTSSSLEDLAEQIVRSMLFAGAAPLTEPITGTSSFAAEFANQGPRDSKGRSVRELDLKTRLLRYPLSYLVYSESFNQMPAQAKQHVYRRLREVLKGQDKSQDFAHLSDSDRQAILEILRDTKPDFAALQ